MYCISPRELLFLRQGTTFCLEGEGQTEMTVTQAEQPWSALLLLSVVVWGGRTRDLLLLMLLLRWWCGISSYSLSLSTPLSVKSAKQQRRFTDSAISTPVGGFKNFWSTVSSAAQQSWVNDSCYVMDRMFLFLYIFFTTHTTLIILCYTNK